MTLSIDAPRAITALERFVELTAADRRDRVTRGVVRLLAGAMAGALSTQSVMFRKGLVGLKANFSDPVGNGPVWPGNWIPYFNDAADLTRAQMEAGLFDNIWSALMMGGGHLVDDVGVPLTIGFNLENPRAVAWAYNHAAAQVTKINEATREAINRVIVNAVENGHSYTRTAETLARMFEFSPGRAHRIAVYETGNAYERGKLMAADEIVARGLPMEKRWISAGDSRVRPAHVANHLAMWIPKDARFPGDGADLPPTDPGCRCSVVWRVAPDK